MYIGSSLDGTGFRIFFQIKLSHKTALPIIAYMYAKIKQQDLTIE